jgi:hypothetical protein
VGVFVTFAWNPRVFDDAMRMAGKGLQAATIYAANATKEILSVPAPRVRLTDSKGGKYYRAGFKLSPTYGPQRADVAVDNPQRMGPGFFDVSRARFIKEKSYKFPKGGIGPAMEETVTYQTAPAIRGEPPRKLSGALRRSIAYEFLDPMKTFEGGNVPTKGRVGTNIHYARSLEYHRNDHEFLGRVFRERKKEIEQVLYDNATAAL